MSKSKSKQSLETLKPYTKEIIEKYKYGYTAEQKETELAKLKKLIFALDEDDLEAYNVFLDALDA